MAMLKVENLSVHYGVIQAVKDVSLTSMKGKSFLLLVPMVLARPLFYELFRVWCVQVQGN